MIRLKAGIFGCPLNKSLSPAIFKFLFLKFKMSGSYKRMPTDKAGISLSIAKALKNNWNGFNITLPCKEEITKKVHKLRGLALKIKTVNVVKIEREKIIGYNTDVFGFLASIKEHKLSVKNEVISLWGAGGAAKAVCWALGELGARAVLIHGRNKKRTEELSSVMKNFFPKTKFKSLKFTDKSFLDSKLLINATPLGMYHDREKKKLWNIPEIKKGAAFYDLAYGGKQTAFLKLGSMRKSKKVIDGKDMLIYQAIKSFEIWTGKKIENILRLKKEIKIFLEKEFSQC
ncbi:MAG: shikimate dehydrogenase [Elusimicrobia bacterium]|nr:shikimate dehydrogenase [Elusimicrobiota bacterium]